MGSDELTLSKHLVQREPKYADKELRVMQMIVTTIARRGDGKKHPIRAITQFWSMDGELIGEVDPMARAPECIEKNGV